VAEGSHDGSCVGSCDRFPWSCDPEVTDLYTVNIPWFFHLINCNINSKNFHNLYFETLLHKLYVYSIFLLWQKLWKYFKFDHTEKTIRFSEHCFFAKTVHRFKVYPHIITKWQAAWKKLKSIVVTLVTWSFHGCEKKLCCCHAYHMFFHDQNCHFTLIRLKHMHRTDNL